MCLGDRKRARDANRQAVEEEKKRKDAQRKKKASSSQQSRANCKDLNIRMQRIEKMIIGNAGVYPKDERHAATARNQVRNPRPFVSHEAEEVTEEELFGELEKEGDSEPSDGETIGSKDTDAESDDDESDGEDAYWKRRCVQYALDMLSHATPLASKLPKCNDVPLQVVIRIENARGRLRVCLYEAKEAKDQKHSMLGVEMSFKKLFSTYISTKLWVVRARAIAPLKKGTGAKRRDDPTGGGHKGADRGANQSIATPETGPTRVSCQRRWAFQMTRMAW